MNALIWQKRIEETHYRASSERTPDPMFEEHARTRTTIVTEDKRKLTMQEISNEIHENATIWKQQQNSMNVRLIPGFSARIVRLSTRI
jgi:hypothetical protein